MEIAYLQTLTNIESGLTGRTFLNLNKDPLPPSNTTTYTTVALRHVSGRETSYNPRKGHAL